MDASLYPVATVLRRASPLVLLKKYVSWENLQIDAWKVVSPDKLRLRLKLRFPWYKPVGEPYPVDAEVRRTSEEAEMLRDRIQRWRGR